MLKHRAFLGMVLPLSLSVALSLSISLSRSLSRYLSMSLSVSLSISLSLSVALFLSLSLAISLSRCLSLALSLSVALALCLARSLAVSRSPPSFLSRVLSLSLCLSLWQAPLFLGHGDRSKDYREKRLNLNWILSFNFNFVKRASLSHKQAPSILLHTLFDSLSHTHSLSLSLHQAAGLVEGFTKMLTLGTSELREARRAVYLDLPLHLITYPLPSCLLADRVTARGLARPRFVRSLSHTHSLYLAHPLLPILTHFRSHSTGVPRS